MDVPSPDPASVASVSAEVKEEHCDEDGQLRVHWWIEQQPRPSHHAHFDCFSGAAGDMMLAACLDAANHGAAAYDDNDNDDATLHDPDQGAQKLLRHIVQCLRCGLPELADEFAMQCQRVWRGRGSITALHVQVDSIYQHAAAPVPPPPVRRPTTEIASAKDDDDDKSPSYDHHHQHEHEHRHDHHGHEHSSHSHNHQQQQQNADLKGEHDSSDFDLATSSTNNNNDDCGQTVTSTKNHVLSHRHEGDSHVPHHNHAHQHSHQSPTKIRNLPEIRQMLLAAPAQAYLPPWVRERALETFVALARAEATVHGAASIRDVHFHEVGAVDSLVDTIGTLVALFCCHAQTFSCSRVPLGEGRVWTAHGILPVPAPATLQLLLDLPTTPGPPHVTGELVTPTGAALLRTLVVGTSSRRSSRSGSINSSNGSADQAPNDERTLDGRPPRFTLRKVGVGAGTKDFAQHPNVLRLLLGDTVVPSD